MLEETNLDVLVVRTLEVVIHPEHPSAYEAISLVFLFSSFFFFFFFFFSSFFFFFLGGGEWWWWSPPGAEP
jgi:hypothetical protein